jgi:hypothetical protein
MAKKIWLGLAALSISALAAETALGATITLNSTCTFAEAVGWINTPTSATSKDGCTRSGSFGSNDTIVVGLDHQEFTIGDTVEIKKKMTIQSWSIYGTLKTTSTSTPIAIKIAAKDIVVQFNGIIVRGVANNTTTGIHVDGTADTPGLGIDAFKVIMSNSRITGFRRTGMYIYQGSVKMSATQLDDNSNLTNLSEGGGRGGAVRIESSTKAAKLLFQDGWVVGNRARRGGAFYNHGVLQFSNSSFYDNVATRIGGGGTGAVVFAENNPVNYYTAFSGGGHFENNQADPGGYSIVAGAAAEFGLPDPFTAIGNSVPLCENAFGAVGCPTQ